jgi:hypothetical protein
MNPVTYAAFVDELEKIAVQGPFEMADQHVSVNSSLHPLEEEGKNQDWRQQKLKKSDGTEDTKTAKELAKEYASRIRAAAKESPPAREANNLFGLPLGQKKRNVRQYDSGSAAAASPDRSQSPTDAQSTANVAAGNTMSPATGPGGV